MIKQAKQISIFYSYAHEDERLRNKLEKHLGILRQQGFISEWHDRKISAGKEWANEIDTHLNSSDIILLLVSSYFLSSDYCYDVEMKRAMERHDAGEAIVIPVILRPCDWHNASFGKLQALPKDGRAVTIWSNRDKAFLDVAQGIREVVVTLSKVEDDVPKIGEEQSRHHEEEQSSTTKIATLHADIYPQKAEDARKHGNWDLIKPNAQQEPTGKLSQKGFFQVVVSHCRKTARDEESQSGRSVKPINLYKRKLLVALVILPFLLLFLLLPILWLSAQQQTKPSSTPNDREVQDQNLDLQYIDTQQNTFTLPGDPLKLSHNQLSKQGVPVFCFDQPKQQVPTVFRIAIRISNLRRDQYELSIEQVHFIVEQFTSIPHPLNALVQNPPALSNYNLYRGTYRVQDTKVPIAIGTKYDYPPHTYVYLTFHETDTINIQVTSVVEALLSFRIAITYRVASEGQTHTLTLPKMFQVVFSDKSNLHLYQQLQDGHFTHLDTP
jgi:TIR domain-containing protein